LAGVTHVNLAFEPASGLVEPGTDDATCWSCDRQAMLYVLDRGEYQIFSCLDHHGLGVLRVIRGELQG